MKKTKEWGREMTEALKEGREDFDKTEGTMALKSVESQNAEFKSNRPKAL